MKMMRLFISGQATLAFAALCSGIYAYFMLSSNASWEGVVPHLRNNPLVTGIISASCVHFTGRAADGLFRGKVKNIPSSLVFLSMAVLIAGLYLSISHRKAEKERVSLHEATLSGLRVVDIKMNLPRDVLVVGESADFKIDNVEVVVEDRGEKKTLKAYPFVKTSAGYAYINDAGVSSDLKLTVEGNEQTIYLFRLFPPGRTESLQATPGYKLEVSLSPEREFKKGRLVARQYSLVTPQYRTIIRKGNAIVVDTVLGNHQGAGSGTVKLQYGELRKWVELIVVKDHALFMLYAGVIGLCVGVFFLPMEMYLHFNS